MFIYPQRNGRICADAGLLIERKRPVDIILLELLSVLGRKMTFTDASLLMVNRILLR